MAISGIIGALLIGLSLGLLGAGGSIITTPMLIYAFDQPVRVAVAESLIIVGSIASYGALLQYKQKNIDFLTAFKILPACLLGMVTGSQVTAFVNADIQLFTFAIVALTASILMISPKQYQPLRQGQEAIIPIGFVIGCMAGFVGVGGGFLIVPALVLFAQMAPKAAASTSIFIIACQSLLGFVSYQFTYTSTELPINWWLVSFIIFIGLVGINVGTILVRMLSQTMLRIAFGYCLAGVSVFIVYSNL